MARFLTLVGLVAKIRLTLAMLALKLFYAVHVIIFAGFEGNEEWLASWPRTTLPLTLVNLHLDALDDLLSSSGLVAKTEQMTPCLALILFLSTTKSHVCWPRGQEWPRASPWLASVSTGFVR